MSVRTQGPLFLIETQVERHPDVIVDKILSVSMKPESKDRIFLVRTDIACVSHTNLFTVL